MLWTQIFKHMGPRWSTHIRFPEIQWLIHTVPTHTSAKPTIPYWILTIPLNYCSHLTPPANESHWINWIIGIGPYIQPCTVVYMYKPRLPDSKAMTGLQMIATGPLSSWAGLNARGHRWLHKAEVQRWQQTKDASAKEAVAQRARHQDGQTSQDRERFDPCHWEDLDADWNQSQRHQIKRRRIWESCRGKNIILENEGQLRGCSQLQGHLADRFADISLLSTLCRVQLVCGSWNLCVCVGSPPMIWQPQSTYLALSPEETVLLHAYVRAMGHM